MYGCGGIDYNKDYNPLIYSFYNVSNTGGILNGVRRKSAPNPSDEDLSVYGNFIFIGY